MTTRAGIGRAAGYSIVTASVVFLAACPGSTTKTESPVSEKRQGKSDVTEKQQNNKPSAETESFAARCREGLDRAKSLLPQILAAKSPRSIENTLDVYNDMLLNINRSAGTAGLMAAVHPDETIREAARACEREVDAFTSELKLNRDLYEAFVGLDTSTYDSETKRLVGHTLRDFRHAGVDRDEATRKRLKEIDDRLTELGQNFQKNIVDDVRHITTKNPGDLAGMPDDFIAAHKPDKNGEIKISTDYPDYMPFISYADSNELRQKLYIAFKSRGGEENERILGEILKLRAEKAKTLGHAHWADYVTEDKMMKSAKNAAEFIERVVAVAKKRARSDYEELMARKRKDHPGAAHVEDYEKTYYENKIKAEKYSFDPQSVRPFFPYQQVENGLLAITSAVYGIEYKKASDAEVWHPDVKAYDVLRGSDNLGRIYLDMHPREGKYKHAAQFPYRTGLKGKQLPEGVLVCNFPNPRTSSGPALMEHADVVTMFHEFGHLMHHIFGGHKRWFDQSGVATEWDFVEAPSQMFEEWAWEHSTLRTFAKHHQTGDEISAETVARMRRADKFGLGVATVQQMFYASISLNFHTADPDSLDMTETVKQLQAKYTPFRYVEGTRFHANFGHLYGYSAIYYTYMWSLVIAKDLLTPFKKHGLMNTEWTYRYRDRILAPGGSKDAADLVRDFLGRDYTFDAFEEYLGS
ncbi:MAG: Zn-dependent oligopeptidase [Proteobacteria bacterium]|nr:Zn-dependent oligopeptidase [Pseudomonadota bacterium]